ncbi:MAG: peptidoglycan DD-metalloendopeptidase family protein [Flavobacteriaceae bacterium]|nr:peptidoglycan DD-metalloendopeptidase family protein [Flavobacteriaceae bacterium]
MKRFKFLGVLVICICFFACDTNKTTGASKKYIASNFKEVIEFGYNLNNFKVIRDTIKNGDSFGEILERNRLGYPKIFQIAEKAKDSFDIRKLQIGKPYMLLCSKDTLQQPQSFIYQLNKVEYVVIEFCDSIVVYKERKPITIVEKEASGVIESSFSETMDNLGLPTDLTYNVADVYAWTLDFYKLQKGDRFKILYKQRFIEDSIHAGIESIDATYFEHKNEPLYAFKFMVDETRQVEDYFDENANSLRRTFLTSPIKFKYRISSRYNLNRRIAYYGNKIRPHKGTDFAAAIGTPIIATANGTVTESTRRGGNGKYVKIKHNSTYSTQYLHMKAQNVKKGDYVKQGDVIGWVGMTGNTGGPHVCYRFWKNGEQVDPFKQKLPAAEAIPDTLKAKYKTYIEPLKARIDAVTYPEPIHEELSESTITQLEH